MQLFDFKMATAIDMRSDTVTLPSDAMRQAMATAACGDDVMGEDPTVNELERRMAELCGKEAALFVTSGTMGNLIATMVHCQGLFAEVICGDISHTCLYEVGSVASICHAHQRQVHTNPDGTLPLSGIEDVIVHGDIHATTARLLILENTHNKCGGRVLPLDYVRQCRALCDKHHMAMHCDGARLWNAAVALHLPVKTLCEAFDSVSLCLSKGLGAPVGSVLVGSKKFIADARQCRKLLGGGMRQAGILAAAGIFALDNMFARLQQDHDMAAFLGQRLSGMGVRSGAP